MQQKILAIFFVYFFTWKKVCSERAAAQSRTGDQPQQKNWYRAQSKVNNANFFEQK
jgi:hypothetical protein